MRSMLVLRWERWCWRLLVIEALAWLVLASLALRILPFRRLAVFLGAARPPEGMPAHPAPMQAVTARRVGRSVRRAVTILPWSALCLPQAMAARGMLARRGIRTRLHLGAAVADGLQTHAWLTLGALTVTGGGGRSFYAELASFG